MSGDRDRTGEAPTGTGMNLKALRELPAREARNILDIEVPAEFDQFIATGIGYLDDAFGGQGITPSTSAIFTGHQVVYNSREESLEQIRRTTRRLGFSKGFIAAAARRVPDVIGDLRELRRVEVDRLKQAHERLVAAWFQLDPNDRTPEPPPLPPPPRQVLVLDSLQAHDCGKYRDGGTNSMTPIRIAEQLTDWCKETFNVAIMIGHVTKSGKIAGKQQLVHTVDMHCHVKIEQDSDSPYFGDRVFGVYKNRYGCSGIGYVLRLSAAGFAEKGKLKNGILEDSEDT
jgi:predicted ATP-dependent serine protease